ncbi:MAG: hypothetical protein ACOYLE_06295, partial [Bacteroidales bacterium]
EEIISATVSEYSYPVCYHFPAGHQDDNRALILGRKLMLNIGETVELQFADSDENNKNKFSVLKKSYVSIIMICVLFVFIYAVIKLITYLLG